MHSGQVSCFNPIVNAWVIFPENSLSVAHRSLGTPLTITVCLQPSSSCSFDGSLKLDQSDSEPKWPEIPPVLNQNEDRKKNKYLRKDYLKVQVPACLLLFLISATLCLSHRADDHFDYWIISNAQRFATMQPNILSPSVKSVCPSFMTVQVSECTERIQWKWWKWGWWNKTFSVNSDRNFDFCAFILTVMTVCCSGGHTLRRLQHADRVWAETKIRYSSFVGICPSATEVMWQPTFISLFDYE